MRKRALVLARPDKTQDRIRAAFDRLAQPYHTDAGLKVPVSVKVASGRKPT